MERERCNESYEYAQQVWKDTNCHTLEDYTKIYMINDVLLLADVFETFRNVSLKEYKLDPCWYYTSPGLAWDAMLYRTGVKLQTIKDVEMYNFIEKGIRGGMCNAVLRYSKANNKYMSNYNPKEESKYLLYLDANNLYGWAMSQKLPYDEFEFIDSTEFSLEMIENLNSQEKVVFGPKVDEAAIIIYDIENLRIRRHSDSFRQFLLHQQPGINDDLIMLRYDAVTFVSVVNLPHHGFPNVSGDVQVRRTRWTPENWVSGVTSPLGWCDLDGSDRSNAGYSIKYNKDEKKYTIGNKYISFDQNIIKVNSDEYTATEGLMELLTKKSPNLKMVSAEDTKNYQTILLCSNGLYQGFDKNSKRYNSDASDKWAFIKANYSVTKTPAAASGSSQGSSITFMPSNTNSLIDSLRLSVGSYQAGNKDEYNKIHAILDKLVKQKIIKKKDSGVIYLNIGL
ncbi:unnamed protein product [Caenorhabditis nigoni]